MSTEEASTVTTQIRSLDHWASWLGALVGLWVLASPFVLSGAVDSGTALWSTVGAGAVIAILAIYGAYTIRTSVASDANSLPELGGWVAGLAGLWIVGSPFVIGGDIAGTAMMASNVVAGLVAFVLMAYVGYYHYER